MFILILKRLRFVPILTILLAVMAPAMPAYQQATDPLAPSGNSQLPSYPEAARLLRQAASAIQAGNANEARDLLGKAERVNPIEPGLLSGYARLAMLQGKTDEAIDDFKKEIKLHADEISAYAQLASVLIHAGRVREAVEICQAGVAARPQDERAVTQLGKVLMRAKRYSEVLSLLDKPIAAAPHNYLMQALRVSALLQSGKKEQATEEARRIVGVTSDAEVLNDLAYAFADTAADARMAEQWVRTALKQTEQDAAKFSLASIDNKAFATVSSLAAEWDTLGWLRFLQDDLPASEKYVRAAWQLNEHPAVADHLAQIYEKQGRKDDAIHLWRLTLALDQEDEGAKEHLQKAGVPGADASPVNAAAELVQLRTIDLPEGPKQTGKAGFYLLIGRDRIEDAKAIGGPEAFKDAGSVILSSPYHFEFPDSGPEKIVRRGMLACSPNATPACQVTLELTSIARAAKAQDENATGEGGPLSTGAKSPMLRRKVEPEYTDGARQMGLEGVVFLRAVVDEEGIPRDISVFKSLGMGLDENAVEAVRQWRFDPGTKDGKPVRVRVTLQIQFRLLKNAR